MNERYETGEHDITPGEWDRAIDSMVEDGSFTDADAIYLRGALTVSNWDDTQARLGHAKTRLFARRLIDLREEGFRQVFDGQRRRHLVDS